MSFFKTNQISDPNINKKRIHTKEERFQQSLIICYNP